MVTSYRRRRIVAVTHRVVFGTMDRGQQGLAVCGGHIQTAVVERLPLDSRQRVAAGGRRGPTRCQGEDGWRQQLGVFHPSQNFCLPQASFRQPLRVPEPTQGSGSAQPWRPCPPAMAAGLTDHGWSLRDGVL